MTVAVQPRRPGEQRSTGIYFQSTCWLCRGSLKAPLLLFAIVYICILNPCTCAVEYATDDVVICINELRSGIEKSDAMLYTPSANDVKNDCNYVALSCYILELIMVIGEEEIGGGDADCIREYNEISRNKGSVDCPPCEAYLAENTTIFMEGLQSLLQKISVIENNVI